MPVCIFVDMHGVRGLCTLVRRCPMVWAFWRRTNVSGFCVNVGVVIFFIYTGPPSMHHFCWPNFFLSDLGFHWHCSRRICSLPAYMGTPANDTFPRVLCYNAPLHVVRVGFPS